MQRRWNYWYGGLRIPIGHARVASLGSPAIRAMGAKPHWIWRKAFSPAFWKNNMSDGPIRNGAGFAPSCAARSSIHRLRRRYAELLHEAVGRTAVNPAEIDGEVCHLIPVINR